LQGFDIQWCKQPDIGLPQPDLVLFLTLGIEEAAKRACFGGERYEQTDFQKKVAANYDQLIQDDWKVRPLSYRLHCVLLVLMVGFHCAGG
jgi:dTMP kinase